MKLRNPIAKELRTPKYKSKVVENKKKKLEVMKTNICSERKRKRDEEHSGRGGRGGKRRNI